MAEQRPVSHGEICVHQAARVSVHMRLDRCARGAGCMERREMNSGLS